MAETKLVIKRIRFDSKQSDICYYENNKMKLMLDFSHTVKKLNRKEILKQGINK